MAFPTIAASTEASITADSNRHVLTYPACSAGDLLLVIGVADGAPSSYAIGDLVNAGPQFPGTTASLANAGTSENAEAWVNPGNASADDGTTTSITAATYDTPDISQLLVCSNFGFSVPSDAVITGITVEIDRNNAAGAASDNRVQLAKGTTFANLVGTNKADTALDWPAALTIASYGSNTDLWGTTWTPAEVNASSFAVMLSVQADAANTDIAVDFIRITVHYVENDFVVNGFYDAPSAAARSIFGKKVAAGTESGNFGVGLSSAEEGAWKVLVIQGWEGTLGINFTNSDPNGGAIPWHGNGTGTSTTPDGGAHDPFNWGAEDTLWIRTMFADGGDTTSSGVPTNYTRIGTALNTGGATGVCLDVAFRQLNTSSEDPSSTTISASVPWGVFVLAVRPVPPVVGPPMRPNKLQKFLTLR